MARRGCIYDHKRAGSGFSHALDNRAERSNWAPLTRPLRFVEQLLPFCILLSVRPADPQAQNAPPFFLLQARMAVRWLLLLLLLQRGAEAAAPSVSRNVTGWHRRLNAANCTPTQTKESAQSNGRLQRRMPRPQHSSPAANLALRQIHLQCRSYPFSCCDSSRPRC